MIVIANTCPENRISYKTTHSAGFDICSSVDVIVQPMSMAVVPTGLYIEMSQSPVTIGGQEFVPELQIRPRSGLSANGIIAIFGTVDADYRGEIKVILYNTKDVAYKINKGMRIAQGVFALACRYSQIPVEINERGTGGLGSTGL